MEKIEGSGASPIFFMTWARLDGWPEEGLGNYESMQSQITTGYLDIASELRVPVAPVGYAWSIARNQYPQLELWQEDGSHPSQQGTYLAACVFYAVIFRETPQGLDYYGGAPKEEAELIQTIAGNTVLGNPSQWNLP